MKIVCRLGFDARKDIGLSDRIDPETGEVLKTAEDALMELCALHPELRPCSKRGPDGRPNRWVEKRRGCILLNGKRRCPNCLEVVYEEGDIDCLKRKAPAGTGATRKTNNL